jgi:hypothetical protein
VPITESGPDPWQREGVPTRPDFPGTPARGDTEIELQLLDVTDPGIMDKTTQSVKIILGRL